MNKFEKVSFAQYYIDRKKLDDSVTKKQAQEEYDPIKLPTRATGGSAGYDFYAPYGVKLGQAEASLFGINKHPYHLVTGIRWVGEPDMVLICVPRSGMGFKYNFSLYNTVGVIDSDYFKSDNEGHIAAKVCANENIEVKQGQAFMQGIIMPFIKTDDDCTNVARNGGFGSTDKK